MRTLQRELVRKVVFALIAFLTHGCGRFIDMYDMSCQRNTKSFVGGILDIPEFLRVDIPEFRMRAFFERTVCWTKAPKKTRGLQEIVTLSRDISRNQATFEGAFSPC